MRAVIVANPRSGRGRALGLARRTSQALVAAGHEAQVVEIASGNVPDDFEDRVREADALLVAGGDGSVHSNADIAIRTGTPLYHVPAGNENLFAREFNMSREPGAIIGAMDRNQVEHVDLGRAGAMPFVLMASVGPDASVIHRLARIRSGSGGHLAYTKPIIAELMHPVIPEVTVTIDGEQVVEGHRGMVLVANCRQYAARLDPACKASMSDGLLDVVFLPMDSAVDGLVWTTRLWTRRHVESPIVVYRQAKHVRIESLGSPAPLQIDGEAPGITPDTDQSFTPPESQTPVELSIEAGVLPVLVG